MSSIKCVAVALCAALGLAGSVHAQTAWTIPYGSQASSLMINQLASGKQDYKGTTGSGLIVMQRAPTLLGQVFDQDATTTSPGYYAQLTGDAYPRVRVGLNATDVASLALGSGAAVRDTFLERAGPANMRFGGPDNAAPVAQTSSVQNVVAGTSNTAGANRIIAGSQGTGTGAGGSILFQVAPAGLSGSAQNALATAMTIGSDKSVTFAGAVNIPGAVGLTSLALNGCTIGSNAFCATGTANISGAVTVGSPLQVGPASSSGALFTPSTGLLTVTDGAGSGATLQAGAFRIGTDTPITRAAAGVVNIPALTVNGASIGTNALAVTGAALLTGNLSIAGGNGLFFTNGTNLFDTGNGTIRVANVGATNSFTITVGASNLATFNGGITATGTLSASNNLDMTNTTVSRVNSLRFGSNSATQLQQDADNTLALRNGVNAQTFNIYNTYTDAANYEAGQAYWNGNQFYVGTRKSGTGTARPLNLQTDGNARWQVDATGNFLAAADTTNDIGASGASRPRNVYIGTNLVLPNGSLVHDTADGTIFFSNHAATNSFTVTAGASNLATFNGGVAATTLTAASGAITASAPGLNLTQTWNNGAVAFTALKANVTNTASSSSSLLIDLQVGGSSKFSVDYAGNGSISGVLTPTYFQTNTGGTGTGPGAAGNTGFAKFGVRAYTESMGSTAGTYAQYNNFMLATSTLTNSNAITITDAANATFYPIACSTNVTCTRTWGIFQYSGNAYFGGQIETKPVAFSALTTCNSGYAGLQGAISDSTLAYTSANIGTAAAGGSSNYAKVTCDGTSWKIGQNDLTPANDNAGDFAEVAFG